MTQREAKVRAVRWMVDVLRSDLHAHCCLHEDDDTERTDADADRMWRAFEELRLETERRLTKLEREPCAQNARQRRA